MSNKSSKKKEKQRRKITRSKTLNFSKKNENEKETLKQLQTERKRLDKERRKLESEKKQLKHKQNKFENETQQFKTQNKRKTTKEMNITKRLQHEIDDYKAEVHSLKKYKKQIISLKKRQQNKSQKKKKQTKVQYVWTENIKQITILNHGVSVMFDDDSESRLFPHIKVILPETLKENNKMIHYMLNELQYRIEDMKHIHSLTEYSEENKHQLEQYVQDIVLKRHTAHIPHFKRNINRLIANNQLWRYSLMRKEDDSATHSVFSVWMHAQNQMKKYKQPDICKEYGIVLNNIHKEKKLKMVHELDAAFSARRYQHHINTKTTAMDFLIEHHGQYEYDEDEDLDETNHLKLALNDASSATSTSVGSALLDLKTPSHSVEYSASFPSTNDAPGVNEEKYTTDVVAEYVSKLQITDEEKALLVNIGMFLNEVRPSGTSTHVIAYDNVKDILIALMDGVIFADVINTLQCDLIDLRLMNVNRKRDINDIIENMLIVVNSMYASDLLGDIGVNPLTISDEYFDPLYTIHIVIKIAQHVINGWFNNELNIEDYPELIRLCQNEDEKMRCKHWSYTIWLKRWLLFIKHPKLKHKRNKSGINKPRRKSLKHSIDLRDHLRPKDMIDMAQSRSMPIKSNTQSATVPENDTLDINIICDYQQDIEMVRSTLKLDIMDTKDTYMNSYYVQEWILLKMFKIKNNIESLSENEKQSIPKQLLANDDEDTLMMAWINWMNACNDFKWKMITNLEDCNDGFIILHLLHLCKPQCVDFNNKKIKSKIRNKFDKITNCKEILSICEHEFKFKLIGINENVIVDGNKKYIKSLLTQIKHYHCIQTMRIYLNMNNAMDITDDLLLKWSNNVFETLKQNNNENIIICSSQISGLRDENALSDSLYFLNLISSVNDKYIDYSLINKDNKLKNAIYLMTVLRKLGLNVFANAIDIVQCKYYVMLSIICCIMDIAHR